MGKSSVRRGSEIRIPPIYMVRSEDKWGEGTASDGLRYRCLQAMNKVEVRQYLRGHKRLEAVRVRLDEDFRFFVERATQEIRKLVYEGAASFEDLDRMAPWWRRK